MNVICPEELVGKKQTSVVFQSPTGDTVTYLTCEDDLFEIVKHESPLGCLFIGDSVVRDNSFHFLTKVNPVLISLDAFYKNDKQFKSLDDLLDAANLSNLLPFLKKHSNSLKAVNEIKTINEEDYYRFSQEKAVDWIIKKVDKVVQVLKSKGISVSSKAVGVAGMVSEPSEEDELDMKRHAFAVIEQYLPDSLSSIVINKLGIEEKKALQEKPVEKNGASNDMIVPTEDYSTDAKKKKVEKDTKTMTRSQKQLLKVDKTGMKSITSFFAKKN